MSEPNTIDARLRKHELWGAENKGHSDTFWADQRTHNLATTRAMTKLTESVQKMNIKITYVIGFGSALGMFFSGAGSSIVRAFTE